MRDAADENCEEQEGARVLKCDVLIIGAGVTGCAVAYELSKYQLCVTVVEQASDVAAGTSGRNSGVVHAGFNNKPGSLMAKLCVEGSQGFEALCSELGVPWRKTGKYVVAFDQEDVDILENLIRQGVCNGVRGLRMAGAEELRENIPHVGGLCAMYSPETAVINPFQYTIALAEAAAENGVRFYFDHRVDAIRSAGGGYEVHAGNELYQTKYLVNCAGLHSGEIAGMMGVHGFRIYPCRGEYFILDKVASQLLSVPVYPAPKPGIGGLGVHLTPTIDGNILIGPSAEYIEDPEDHASTAQVMDSLFSEAKQLLPVLERRHIIGSYCGNRAKLAPPEEGGFRDFVIREFSEAPGAIQLIGIESPGLTASMPIARMVVRMLAAHELPVPKKVFIRRRRIKARFHELPLEEQRKLIAEDPDYGEIVCRCEQITKREIRDAIENILGVRTVSGIKYRCWATAGRCQGGYCLTRIADILIRDYGMSPEEITLRGGGSHLFEGMLREVER